MLALTIITINYSCLFSLFGYNLSSLLERKNFLKAETRTCSPLYPMVWSLDDTDQVSFSHLTAEKDLYDPRALPSDTVPLAPERLGGEEDGPSLGHRSATTPEGSG